MSVDNFPRTTGSPIHSVYAPTRYLDRTRRAILVTLLVNGGSQTSGKIAGRMDHSWQTTSRHLRLLEEAGLISVGLQGRERIYTLETEHLTGLLEGWLNRFRSAESATSDADKEHDD